MPDTVTGDQAPPSGATDELEGAAAEIPTSGEADKPSKRRGRPSKSRGAPKSADAGSAKWTIRGVAINVRKMATAAADGRNMTLGDWIEDAILAAVQAQAAGEIGQTAGGLPAERLPSPVQREIEKITARLDAIERDRRRGFFARLFGWQS